MTMLAIGSSRLEAFAQLITLVLIFAFVLALHILPQSGWAIIKKRKCPEAILQCLRP